MILFLICISLHNTNYAKPKGIKKSGEIADNPRYVHSITSQEQKDAVDLIRWVYAVTDMRADSPRFNYYVSRWVVPEKIAYAKANGTFDELTKHCPPIDPAWVRLVPAALDAYRQFIAETRRPRATPASSSKSGKARNKAMLAA